MYPPPFVDWDYRWTIFNTGSLYNPIKIWLRMRERVLNTYNILVTNPFVCRIKPIYLILVVSLSPTITPPLPPPHTPLIYLHKRLNFKNQVCITSFKNFFWGGFDVQSLPYRRVAGDFNAWVLWDKTMDDKLMYNVNPQLWFTK